MKRNYYNASILIIAAALLTLSGCATLQKYSKIEEPQISINSIDIKRMDLKSVDLELGIWINNNNPVSLQVAGVDYIVQIEGKKFIEGRQEKEINIKASGISNFSLPIKMDIEELYRIYAKAGNKEGIAYDVEAAAILDLPFVGKKRFPARAKGMIPVIRVPNVRLESLNLEKINFSGAKLKLTAIIENPNAFDINIINMKYSLAINGADWIKNTPKTDIKLKMKKESIVTLPFEISFADLGRSVYSVLVKNSTLNYHLKGGFSLQTGLKFLQEQSITFDKKDKIILTR